ncbi:host attachment family protein [Ahrensia kielensis]|uniref:host attachment family protein n=1 Tax=Ahrensia kielensis TaxID=76980 RepID=UPI00036ACB4D|nr:host attachment family protein [Ahrensia kielensis]
MSKGTVPADALIVVGSGEGAQYFRNIGTNLNIKLKAEGSLKPGDLADQGPSGKQPPDMSDKESMEMTFSKILAEDLYAKAHKGSFDNVVLALDPDTLGEVRPLLHKEVQSKVCMELPKTLVNHPVAEIERSLSAAVS